ncbi:DNA gyrase inhibitor YacG [Geotalea uraniireducens]|nr:DNA gyrase inhibitor YacG [Geotalea uraniireducens]
MKTLKKRLCPQCRKDVVWEENPYRPFCSERCKLIDLGAWVTEDYRIPGEKKADDDEEESE